MKRPSGRWSGPTALAVSLALVWQFALSVPHARGETTDPQESGKSSGALVTERFGTQEKLRERIANPLTSSGTPLETLDGSTQFNAQLFFPSSDRFLEILAQPAGTGDLGTVVVGQDLDLDGTIDYSFQPPFAVSGVCANGVIACTPGTWLDCSFYRWTADAEGRLSLPPASLFELGGCYCINNDCGNSLVWQNLPLVLKDLGGGAAGAVQRVRPGFSVSRVEVGGTTIAYYGQDTSRQFDSATGATSAPQPPTQAAYYQNSFAMAEDTSAAAAGQIADPDSLYSRISTLSDAASGLGNEYSCRVDRIVQVVPRVSFCADPLMEGALEPQIETLSYYEVFSFTGRNRNDGRCKNTGYGCPPVTGATRIEAPPEGSESLGSGAVNFRDRKKKDGKDAWTFDVFDYYQLCVRQYDTATTSISDGCAGLSSTPRCELREEMVDGVTTYRMFNPTRLVPLPSTRQYAGVGTHLFTHDWWRKDRVYVCQDGNPPDFSGIKKRLETIVGSANESATSLYYQDLRNVGGSWVLESGSVTLPETDPVSSCEPACKTRRPKEDTAVTVAGHTGQMRTGTDSYDFFYRPCQDGICPAGPGEEVVKDCQCINDFPEAATIMQVLRQAGKDTLCSDGVPKVPATR